MSTRNSSFIRQLGQTKTWPFPSPKYGPQIPEMCNCYLIWLKDFFRCSQVKHFEMKSSQIVQVGPCNGQGSLVRQNREWRKQKKRERERGLEREKGQEKMGREREKRVFVLFKQFFLIDPVLLASLKSTRQACNFAEN